MLTPKILTILKRSGVVALVAFIIDVSIFVLFYLMFYYVMPSYDQKAPPGMLVCYLGIHGMVLKVLGLIGGIALSFLAVTNSISWIIKRYW